MVSFVGDKEASGKRAFGITCLPCWQCGRRPGGSPGTAVLGVACGEHA